MAVEPAPSIVVVALEPSIVVVEQELNIEVEEQELSKMDLIHPNLINATGGKILKCYF